MGPTFLDRRRATEKLRERGIKLGDHALEWMAANGRGPRYVVLNRKALYTESDLEAWIQAESERGRAA